MLNDRKLRRKWGGEYLPMWGQVNNTVHLLSSLPYMTSPSKPKVRRGGKCGGGAGLE
jgi:hypothetical protein